MSAHVSSGQGANIRNMAELFRLAQVVLEARTMQHHEQETLVAAEVEINK
jgi:hypothetical protein